MHKLILAYGKVYVLFLSILFFYKGLWRSLPKQAIVNIYVSTNEVKHKKKQQQKLYPTKWGRITLFGSNKDQIFNDISIITEWDEKMHKLKTRLNNQFHP